jgi:TRAP-type C4-dicarboxylate transport system permease small subunit
MADTPLVQPVTALIRKRSPSKHAMLVLIAAAAAVLLVAALAVYGWDYYTLPLEMRPFSPKHELLRPSGVIGLNLGVFGVVLFVIIFLYALRKAIPWLGRIGTAKHWMDFHVVAGVAAPIVIAFHASFKFNNIAGAAFWVMLAVALSGIVGRYLYAQIPRSLNASKVSYRELRALEAQLADALRSHPLYSSDIIDRLFNLPDDEHIRSVSTARIFGEMLFLDLSRPWHVAALRRKGMSLRARVFSVGGLLPARSLEVEEIVGLVRRKALLTKRMVFLDRAQRIFHLWHVVHRPFSYAFVVLALIHIVNAVRLGYF